MTDKNIDTLLDDIDSLFINGHKFNENNLNNFLKNLKELLIDRFEPKPDEGPKIRMSMLGTPNRKAWFIFHRHSPRTKVADLKFLYGDIIEQLMLLLSKEAGHTVEDEQKEIEIDGIKGHIDARIDGWVIDLKTASSNAFKKFFGGTLAQNDSFGYIAQISAYMHWFRTTLGGFFAINKETGEKTLLKVDAIDTINAPLRIKEIKEVIALTTPPTEKCYQPVDYGKSGNKALHKNCTYCPFRYECWSECNGGKGLRRFAYASDVVEFTDVVNTPRVDELPSGGEILEAQKANI